MQEYKRENPLFSLCGLNCGLCPRYHMDGTSKCPGCGGDDFHLKHPACAVITCNKKHNNVEYCFQCTLYPCGKYSSVSTADSFITYQNVLSDFMKARKHGLEKYFSELSIKMDFLDFLLENFNDGRKKNFFCIALNLLALQDLTEIETILRHEVLNSGDSIKVKAEKAVLLFESKAAEKNIQLELRKNGSTSDSKNNGNRK
jgi:hypothetical protein